MIEVQHPDGWTPPPSIPDTESQSSIASGGGDFDDIENLLSGADGSSTAAKPSPRFQHPVPVTDKVVHPKPKKTPKSNKPAPSKKRRKGKGFVDPVADSSLEESPILPGKSWSSEAAKKRKSLMLMFGSAVGTVLLVAGIIFAIISTSSSGASDADPNELETAGDASSVAEPIETLAGNANPPADSSPSLPRELPIDQNVVDDSTEPKQVLSDRQPDKGAFSAPKIDSVVDPDLNNMANVQPAAPTIDRSNPKVKPSRASNLQAVKPKFTSLRNLLDGSNTSIRDLQDQSVMLRDRQEFGMAKYVIEKPKPNSRSINVPRQLDLPVLAIQNANPVPLSRMTRMLTTLSGVPITIDAIQSAMMGQPVDPVMDYAVEDATVFTACQSIAKQAGLECFKTEDGLVLSLPVDAELSKATFDFPRVPDLDDDQKQKFVASIKTLIAPLAWTREDTPYSIAIVDDKIQVNCDQGTQKYIGLLIRKLEAAAAISSGDSTAENLAAVESRWTASQSKRESKIDLLPTADMPLGQFFNRITRVSGLSVVVDWQSLAAEGWTMKTSVPGDLVEATAGEAVIHLAKAMRLSLVGADATTLRLTTRRAADQIADLEVYPLPAGWAGQMDSEEVEQLIFDSLGRSSRAGFLRIVYEPKCNCCVVVAPQSTQRLVEQLIERLFEVGR
jgi:hypothetical protein